MDTDYPSAGAVDGYRRIVGELDIRAQQAVCRGLVDQLPETCRDNPLYGRFELLVDSSLAVYIKYTMTGGQVILTEGVEHPAFRDQGMDAILMRHVVLNTHKRRLSLIPQYPIALSFLADHPTTKPSPHGGHIRKPGPRGCASEHSLRLQQLC